MEQFKEIVLEAPPEGMEYIITKGENGKRIIRLARLDREFFTKITADDREKVKIWLAQQIAKTSEENEFLDILKVAVREVDYDYWIANLEPSVEHGKIRYEKGNNIAVGFCCSYWQKMAKEYDPQKGSRLCNLYELFIWYALRIANKLWTLDYVANNSSNSGNYMNSPSSAESMEKAGARVCGGYRDGQGNASKIVATERGYLIIGGNYGSYGQFYPVASISYPYHPDSVQNFAVGVLILLK